jgi:GH15 family glucan-1,4-alpha-glucosidase
LLLKDYGIIGNLNTCALINREGNVDWCCFPNLESQSVFAGILDNRKGGRFLIQPDHKFNSAQKYLRNTNVLRTKFYSIYGDAQITDFMPINTNPAGLQLRQALYRKLECTSGEIVFKVEFSPAFDYGRAKTEFRMFENGVDAFSGDHHLFLYAPKPLELTGSSAGSRITLKHGETVWFLLRYNLDHRDSAEECAQSLGETMRYWKTWAYENEKSAAIIFHGLARRLAVRSGLILKLLMNDQTGSIAAAATTSIPEEIGGVRNWDYRFNWIRDASFTIQALYHLGHPEEARKNLKWFIQTSKQQKDPVNLKPLYPLDNERLIPEEEIYTLQGYMNSRPVRIGNKASDQVQLDVFGELVNAFYETTRYGVTMTEDDWGFVEKIVNHVCANWNTPDSGIWEARTPPRHYVYSKVMCWVAMDRALKIAKIHSYDAPIDDWNRVKEEIKKTIIEKGFSIKLNSFVQYFGSEDLDATGLLIPIVGFLPAGDPKVQGTINAIIDKLGGKDNLLYRYLNDDGLHGAEGKFFLCSFWLVQALALSGRIKDAKKVLYRVLKYVSPTGLISEEVDTETGELLGNFPQAFSHIGMINSLIYLYKATGRSKELSLMGSE